MKIQYLQNTSNRRRPKRVKTLVKIINLKIIENNQTSEAELLEKG